MRTIFFYDNRWQAKADIYLMIMLFRRNRPDFQCKRLFSSHTAGQIFFQPEELMADRRFQGFHVLMKAFPGQLDTAFLISPEFDKLSGAVLCLQNLPLLPGIHGSFYHSPGSYGLSFLNVHSAGHGSQSTDCPSPGMADIKMDLRILCQVRLAVGPFPNEASRSSSSCFRSLFWGNSRS